MKFSARLLSLILVLTLILSQLSVPVQAREETLDTAVIPFQVNPLYRHLYSPEDFSLSGTETIPVLPEPNAVTYLTVAEAGAQVRQHMKDRETQFTVSFKTNVATYQTAAEQVLEAALVHTGAGDEGDYLMWQYGGWRAKMSRTQSDGMYLFTAAYTLTYYTTAQQETEVDAAVEQLIASLNLRDKSDYEKVCGVYDYLCDNVDYDYSGSSSDPMLRHTAYAALIHHKAVCQGYALLFYRLMLELGVDARLIPGIASGGEAHGWNIVALDGLYYNVDATWDANRSRYSYFLCNTGNFVKHYRYLDYETWEFHDNYPMAAENFDPDSTAEADPVIYSGSCGKNASWILGRDRSLTIRGSGSTYDYDSQTVPTPWQHWEAGIRTLAVEEGIRGIGEGNFSGCGGLTEVQFPEGFTTVEEQAFSDCTGLTELRFPESFSSIGAHAFSGCTGLREIRFLGDAPLFANSAFENVTASIYYPIGNATWTNVLGQNLGGELSWSGYCEAHSYVPAVTAPTCRTQGYTTFTCSLCADSYISDYTDPVAHSYENDICIWCGEALSTVRWTTVNTSLTGSIDLNFYVVLSDNLISSDTFVRFTCGGATLDVPMSEAIPSVKNGVTRYRFSYKVYAKQMTDTVTAQVMTPGGAVGEPKSYSVVQYCNTLMAQTSDADTIALCKAMMNYGAAAQQLFRYNLDSLANATLSESDKVTSDFITSDYGYSIIGSEEGIQASGAKLLLDADVTIQVSFALTGSRPITDFSFTIDGAPAACTGTSGTKYYFELDGIAASRFDEPHAFSVGDLTLNYSVLSYAGQVYGSTASRELRSLVNAMYAYCMASQAYVN